jgi:hypothetical protein
VLTFEPRDYQDEAVKWLEAKPKAALFMDVGLGKSVCSLHRIVTSQVYGDVNHWLIVAPLRVCQTTWPQELEKWAFAKGLTVAHLYGTYRGKKATKTRRKITATELREEACRQAVGSDVTLINLENLTKLVLQFGPEWPWDGVVLDESSKFKDSTSKRWKAVRHVTKHIHSLILLTGSPCAQTLENLWAQVYLLDRGKRLGRTLGAFKMRYFRQVDYMGYEYEAIDGAREHIMEQIKDVCLVIRSEGMPEPILNVLPVMIDLKSLNTYRKMEKDFFLQLRESGEGITAMTAAVLSGKLCQLANGFAYWEDDDGKKQIHDLHMHKITAVEEFADEQGSQFVLGYHFIPDRDRLVGHFGNRLELFDGTPEQRARWHKGEFQILAIHPQSGGHGVDGLQHTCCTVLWYSPPWSREQFDQLNGRVTGARQKGTPFETKQSVVNILVARGTVDDDAHTTLIERGGEQEEFLNALRERSKNYI